MNNFTTKNMVLEKLLLHKDEYISGQKLAKDLNLSRNSIWKAVESLKEDGYKIHAVRNKGYQLILENDIVSKEGIENYLDNKEYFNVEVFDVIDSTNTLAKKYASEGVLEGKVIVAKSQTAGRGRFQRSFYSPSDTGIYFSFILKPKDVNKISLITSIAAISICRSIKNNTDKNPAIKWVNDIFIDNKKVSGILTEATFSVENNEIESVIVGIGINIYSPINNFPSEIENTAGYILNNKKTDIRNKIVASTLNEFLNIFLNSNEEDIHKEYKNNSFIIGKEVYIIKNNEKIKVIVLDINKENHLVVKKENGDIEILKSGEISIKLN